MRREIDGSFWIVTLIAVVIIFFNLGGIPLLDPDEPVYAETPKEMLMAHDLLSPRIYGEYWYDKPPMYYWLVAGSFKLFGVTEFAARFPSALLAVITICYVYLAGTRLLGRDAGIAGALVLATSIEFFYLAKAAVTDITLNLCLTVALLAFIEKRYYLFYIFAGLATVTKGPVGLLFPGAIIFLYLLLTRRFCQLLEMRIPAGLVIYSLVALPWYIYMYSVHGSSFVDTFLGFHNITRFTSPEHPEGVLWYYFIPVLILGFFPWTAVLAQSVWKSFTSGGRDSSILLFLNIWAWFIFVFFSISRTKLVSYILPMFVPLSMITGWYMADLWYRRREFNWKWPLALTVLSALFITGMVIGLQSMPQLALGVYSICAVFVLMTAFVWYFCYKRETEGAFWTKIVGMLLFSLILVGILFPTAAPYFTSKEIAAEFHKHYDGKSPVYVVKFLNPGMSFYADVYGEQINSNWGDKRTLSEVVQGSGPAYFVVQELDYNKLTVEEQQQVTIIARSADRMILHRK